MNSPENPPSPEPRTLGGRYEIHRALAKGGMADVFLARDAALDRPVAVKILFSDFARDQAFVERFRREAQAAANLTHPNIVGVYDWGAEDNTYYIVMEYVDGESLAQIVGRTGPMYPRRVAEIAFDVAGALGAAHRNGVVHRDVKPGNILVTSSGVPKVTDFGIARALMAPNEDLTEAGSVMGTATYFSPEQAQGFPVDARSDLYSLGVVMYEVLCGRPPFTGDNTVAVAYKHVQEAAPRPSEFVADIPEGLEAIVMRLLSKNPDNRYLSAEDLRADLRLFLDGETPKALAGGALAAGALAAAGVAVATDPGATIANSAVSAAPDAGEATTVAAVAGGADGSGTGVDDGVEDGDEEAAEKRKNALFWGLVVVMVLLLAGLGFWLVRSLDEDSGAATVEVPRVVERTEADAKDLLRDAGLNPIVEEEPSSEAAEGVVFKQDPDPGTMAEEGSDVTIFVSTGREVAVLGDLSGRDADEAEADLEALRFRVSRRQVQNGDFAEGLVVETEPAAGSTVEVGSLVTLLVSTGPGAVDIPSVAGLSEQDARATLEAAGFVVGENISESSATVAAGQVIGSDPSGQASPGSTVSLIVSSGQGTVRVPAVRGRTEQDAITAMSAAGLQSTVSNTDLPPGDPQDGRVISTDPASDTEVEVGSTVDLEVGVASASTTTTTVEPTTTAP